MNQLICNTIVGQIAETSSPFASGVATTDFFAVPMRPSQALFNSIRSLTNFTICFSIIDKLTSYTARSSRLLIVKRFPATAMPTSNQPCGKKRVT